MDQPYIYKFAASALTSAERADQLTRLIKQYVPTAERIDTNLAKRLLRMVSNQPVEFEALKKQLSKEGFDLEEIASPTTTTEQISATYKETTCHIYIDGMTCRSCELTVERKWKNLPGVKHVDVNAGSGLAKIKVMGQIPSLEELTAALADSKYIISESAFTKKKSQEKSKPEATPLPTPRPSFWRLIGLFALVLFIGHIFSKLGLLKGNFTVSGHTSFGAVFVIGLVAASSSCIAVVGGLLLSSAAKFNERYGSAQPLARMRPVFLFLLGRIISYAVLGGLLGVVGGILSPSPLVTALITIVAALYMLIMGLDMLQIAPVWLKRLMPRVPKSLSHRIMDAQGKEHPLAPLGLGAATFFLPCGFTQALQLYALTTGSFWTSASLLLAFALGTAPALFALGWASSSLKGRLGKFFFQFSGALVVILGVWNIQNGLTIAGYPLSLPSFASAVGKTTVGSANRNDPNVITEGNTQVVKMGFTNYGEYQPNHFTLTAGKPVRWEVDGTNATGCAAVLTSRQLGIQKVLARGMNTFEFTPPEAGEVKFSCSMGMVRGSFTVLPPT